MICPPDHKHGATSTCYRNHGCRCAACKATNAEVWRAWRAGESWPPRDPYAVDLAIDGERVHLSVEQRAEAVQRLWGRHWSDSAIADRLGVHPRTVLRIRQRRGLRGWEKFEMEKTRWK